MSEPEITNPEKTKNPKRVEQGKRLAAISREAKERKRQQQEKFFESAEQEGNKIFFGIGLIGAAGAAFLVYKVCKIFLNLKREPNEVRLADEDQDEKVHTKYTEPEDVDRRPPEEPAEPAEPTEPTPRKTRSYEPYTMNLNKYVNE